MDVVLKETLGTGTPLKSLDHRLNHHKSMRPRDGVLSSNPTLPTANQAALPPPEIGLKTAKSQSLFPIFLSPPRHAARTLHRMI
ncbi:hypothetical protein IFR05_007381 [Cadophora sp. M221]|nr:hypothetical protein IFR05_007381 [Cadophora sp. M221]